MEPKSAIYDANIGPGSQNCRLDHDGERRTTEHEDVAQPSLDLPSYPGPTCPISLLPFEILHFMFEYATPPSIFLDPTIYRGPYSPWCRMLRQLKSLVLVCRMWCDVGTDLLYHSVVIRQIGQIPALLRSLRSNPKLGAMVHDLQMRCFIPRGYHAVLEQGLTQIYSLCPNVTRLALDHAPCHEFPDVLDSILPSTVELEIAPGYRFQRAISLLLQCRRLVTLTITFNESIDGVDDVPFVVLETLEELHVIWNDRPTAALNTDKVEIISKHCIMPRLTRLSLTQLCQNPESFSSFESARAFYPLLHAYGEKLVYLSTCFFSITCRDPIVRASKDIQNYLDLCPSLQHFTTGGYTGTLGLSHPKLEYLDVWIGGYPSEDCELLSCQEHLPALRNVRFLDFALMGTAGPRLPLVIPPETTTTQSWRYPGIDIRHDSIGIFQTDIHHLELLPRGEIGQDHFRALPFCDPHIDNYHADTDSEDGSWESSQTPTDYSDEFDSSDSSDEESGSPPSSPSSLSARLQEALQIFENILAWEEEEQGEQEQGELEQGTGRRGEKGAREQFG